jgi:hypothetical protein
MILKCPLVHYCRNPSLGLVTKARACKSASQEGSPRVTFPIPGSAKECEGMNLHNPKGTSTLGVGVSMDSQIFRERLQGSKLIGLRCYLYHWKALEMYMSKLGSHDSFGHMKHKLWSKEKPGVKLTIWLPTTKSRELSRFHCVQVLCHISLKIFRQGL